MRFESILSPRVLIAVAVLGLTACSDSTPPREPVPSQEEEEEEEEEQDPVDPISEEKQLVALRSASDGTGSCSFDASPQDLKVVALNSAEYGAAKMCGACAEVELPDKQIKVRVRVVDNCSGCTPTQVGVSPQVFEAMGGGDISEAGVRWRYTTCAIDGPVRYRLKEDSNPYWVAIQVRNHRLPIQKLEWEKNGAWVEVMRQPYNYFIEPAGMGAGPVKLRITATDGQQLVDTLPTIEAAKTYDGAAQFSLQ